MRFHYFISVPVFISIPWTNSFAFLIIYLVYVTCFSSHTPSHQIIKILYTKYIILLYIKYLYTSWTWWFVYLFYILLYIIGVPVCIIPVR